MSLEKWYVIQPAAPQIIAGSTIEGVRYRGSRAIPSTIVPGDWFRDITRQTETLIFEPFPRGHGVTIPYTPEDDEFNLLYTAYPATVPNAKFSVTTEGKSARTRWYRVADTEFVTWGLTALCDVNGVCKQGDVASRGQIVPIQWFSALTQGQIERLCKSGVQSLSWLAEHDPKGQYVQDRPLLSRYMPDPMELEPLYERYPGAHPDYAPPTKKKIATPKKSTKEDNEIIADEDE